MFVILLNFVIFLVSSSHAANILAAMPFPAHSHQIAYTHFWKELSLRGHKVTLITPEPLKDPKLINLTEIDMKWSYEYLRDISTLVENKLNMWNTYTSMYKIVQMVSDAQLAHPSVQDLIHNRKNFDVVFSEFFFPEFLAFAEIYKCPKILVSSMETNAYYHHMIGNPSHPVLNPDIVSPSYGLLSFKERVINTLHSWYISINYIFNYIPNKDDLMQKHFNISATLASIIYDVDMLFLNVNPVIHGPRAIGPTTINIGGIREDNSPKHLPTDLKEFLDGAKNGFIYFSLGSMVKSKELGEQTLKMITETLKEMPYQVVWKFEAENLPEKPNNVKLVQWAPQISILSHPNIKLFITQGGLQSMEEAIYNEVPSVVIPFFGDQEKNANLLVAKGIAKKVDRQPYVKKSDLKKAILEVITNPSYKNSVQRLKHLVLDTPMTGLEKAVWWTEYVIRNKGAKHLRNPAADIPFYQFYLIDVISFLLLTIVLCIAILVFLIKKLLKITLCIFKNRNNLKNKKLK